MAQDTASWHFQKKIIFLDIIFLKNSSELAFANRQIFSLLNKTIFSPNQLLVINLSDFLDELIKQ